MPGIEMAEGSKLSMKWGVGGVHPQAQPGGRGWPERAVARRSQPVQGRNKQSCVGRDEGKGRLWVTHLDVDPTPSQAQWAPLQLC